jgi:hypothetical protein
MVSVSCLVNLGSFCFSLGIQHITTTPYYRNPSPAERFNCNLRAALTAHHADSQTKWDEDLPWLQVAFNIATHEATSMTPFEVIFPFRGKTPLANRWKNQDLPNTCSPLGVRRSWDNVRKHLHYSRRRTERKYNSGRKLCTLKVNDLVWFQTHPLSRASARITAKVSPRWHGLFRMGRFITPVTVELVHPNTGFLFPELISSR